MIERLMDFLESLPPLLLWAIAAVIVSLCMSIAIAGWMGLLRLACPCP